MSDLEDVKARLDRLEHEVLTLREDSATTRVMAAMADRDSAAVAGALKGHTAVLNALRETQIEHSNILAEHSNVLAALIRGQDRHEETLARHGVMLAEILRRLPSPEGPAQQGPK